MKEFTDDELITMAYSEVKKMDIHLWSQIIISGFLLVQGGLLFFSLVSFGLFVVLWVLFMGLYLFHKHKSKKSEIKLQEILDELTSRQI
jgi:hypothetical protein